MAHVLLVLPTSTYRAADFLDAAATLGIELSIASEEAPPLERPDRFVRIDCASPESSADALADLASRQPIDAIVPVDDQSVVVAALAAERIGLPHNPPDAVAATRNKAMMRRRLERGEVPQPSFRVIGPGDDPAEEAAEMGTPVVLKPLSLAASRGVIKVDDPADAAAVAERIRRILAVAGLDPNQPLLMERYVAGPEVAVEALLTDGALEVLAVFDKPDPMEGPYFEETILVTPSRLHPEVLEEVEAVTRRAVRALGLRHGPIHAELRVPQGRPLLLEVAARSIGGLCGRSLRFGLLDTSLEVLLLRHALGIPKPSLHRERPASGVMMLPVPRQGIFRGIDGTERALAVPGITDLEVTAVPGRPIQPPPEGNRYLGFLFAKAATPGEVESSLRTAHALLTVRIE